MLVGLVMAVIGVVVVVVVVLVCISALLRKKATMLRCWLSAVWRCARRRQQIAQKVLVLLWCILIGIVASVHNDAVGHESKFLEQRARFGISECLLTLLPAQALGCHRGGVLALAAGDAFRRVDWIPRDNKRARPCRRRFDFETLVGQRAHETAVDLLQLGFGGRSLVEHRVLCAELALARSQLHHAKQPLAVLLKVRVGRVFPGFHKLAHQRRRNALIRWRTRTLAHRLHHAVGHILAVDTHLQIFSFVLFATTGAAKTTVQSQTQTKAMQKILSVGFYDLHKEHD